MKRLVYSPKVNAYVKTDQGIVDISTYIVSGTITRRTNAVSSAEVVLRNPNFRFTQRNSFNQDTQANEYRPLFHPMDPIAITLTRLHDHPVQTFTGYLDTVPYLDLYPGTCRITASCTLKRLMHTWWDPALNYSQSFLRHYNWVMSSEGQMTNISQEALNLGDQNPKDPTGLPSEKTKDAPKTKKKDKVQALTDSSFSKLLEATLEYVGGWDWSTIHIGELPSDIIPLVDRLVDQTNTNNKAASQEFHSVLHKIIGTASSGGGGMPGGSAADTGLLGGGSSEKQVYCYFVSAGFSEQMAAAITGNFSDETGGTFNPSINEGGGGPGRGIAQWGISGGGPGASGRWPKLQAWAKAKNADPLSLKTQLDYVIYEINQSYRGVLDIKKSTSDPGDLALKFNQIYEGGVTGVRVAQAKAAYSKYKGTCKDTSNGGATTGNSTAPGDNTGSGSSSSSTQDRSASRGGGSTSDASPQGKEQPKNSSGGKGTRLEAIIAEANRMAKIQTTYSQSSRTGPSSWDCSSSCSELMHKAGYNVPYFTTATARSYMKQGKGKDLTFWIKPFGSQAHMFAEFPKKSAPNKWGTNSQHPGHAVSFHEHITTGGFSPWHITGLDQPASIPTNSQTDFQGGTEGSGGSADSGGSVTKGDAISISRAAAFSTMLEGPSFEEIAEANFFTGTKALMNDKPLLPFIEQICTASLRTFMSLPNGHFFAFYPDYFGGLGRQPYWEIDDIEILDGKIELSDDALATHVFVVGDTVGMDGVNFADRILSGGVISVLDAFGADFITGTPVTPGGQVDTSKLKGNAKKAAVKADAPHLRNLGYAKEFLQRYGARPKYIEAPLIRSPYYETFLAYQTFCLMWAEQYLTQFTFTFMPEIYPGGLVSFPDHGIQCYVQEVQHTFDYENGFHTQANLMAPAALGASGGNVGPDAGISAGMVRAFAMNPDGAGKKPGKSPAKH